jgi:hypothetical protein
LLLWALTISALQDPRFNFARALDAVDTYYPILLLVLVNLTPRTGQGLKLPLLFVLSYMAVQIVLYSTGVLIWHVPIGDKEPGDTILRIHTTMGPATGSALTIAVIFTLYWALSSRHDRVGRSMALVCTLVSLVALRSRGALLTFLLAATLHYFANFPSLGKQLARFMTPLRLVPIIATVMLTLFYFTPYLESVGRRFAFMTREDSAIKTGGRTHNWHNALVRHGGAGYLGGGVGTTDGRGRGDPLGLDPSASAHNAYLVVWLESGILGLILFVGMLLYWVLREVRRSRTKFEFWFIVAYITIAFNVESCVLCLEYMVLLMSLISVVSNAPACLPRGIRSSITTSLHRFAAPRAPLSVHVT